MREREIRERDERDSSYPDARARCEREFLSVPEMREMRGRVEREMRERDARERCERERYEREITFRLKKRLV